MSGEENHTAQEPERITSAVERPRRRLKANRFFEEQAPKIIEAAPRDLRRISRRDLILFGAGSVPALAGFGYLLPQDTLGRLGLHADLDSPKKERFLNGALRFDDYVAEALYSPNRIVPTYSKSQITPLMNNYNGATPDPSYIPGWRLTLEGLASGVSVSLDIRTLLARFTQHEQITRLVCVEGWSAIAWWSGLKFDDLLQAYPPISQAKWARVDSSVNLDHGAPLRLLVPVKLGLKNVKAVTKITYSVDQPSDYWAERGYSHYDGI